jgi:uncharacterized membrane protein YidH (DUF202 family)
LSGPSETSTDPHAALAPEFSDPGLARDRTALAWMRSALNIAANGVLIARGAFTAHLDALGVASAVAMSALALLTWRHGDVIYRERRLTGISPHTQAAAFVLLTTATVLIATVAILVSIAT